MISSSSCTCQSTPLLCTTTSIRASTTHAITTATTTASAVTIAGKSTAFNGSETNEHVLGLESVYSKCMRGMRGGIHILAS